MTKITHNSRKLSALLMVGASGLALATPAQANEYLFTSETKPLVTGERMTQSETLTQISLTGGGTASFTDNAQYQINDDGSIELYQGSVTVAGTGANPVVVRMPGGLQGEVVGSGSSANFSVQPNGEAAGHILTGQARVGQGSRLRAFSSGAMWAADPGGRARRVVANDAQSAPDTDTPKAATAAQVVAIGGDAGPVGAALNGIPVTLGDALAAAGASSDILGSARRVEVAVGNPNLDTFPSGDLAALIARAAEIEGAFGGSPFPQAQADIIRGYLRFLAGNGGSGAGAQFLSTFSAFSLDYLDLIRVGGVPSGFASAGLADINAYLAFIDRTGALAQLGAQDRVLANAYLAFLRDGGNPDLFAGSFTDLTDAYFAFVRAGGAPDAFEGASAAVLAQTIAFLSDSGLVQQLNASDQALVAAFLENGGLAFAGQFQSALDDYFAFLANGNAPSAYEPVDQASLRQFLETLSDTGLLTTVLGDQASFYADYLAFLRAGGDVDAFAGLPVNIFTDYAAQLSAYRAFLDAGNTPSTFTGGNPAQLQAFVAELQAAGALDRFTGADADFFAAFAAFVQGGGAFDAFAGLNANIFAGYASDLQAYFAFLEAGGVPSTYEPLSQAVIAQYLAELQTAGAKGRFLPDLADFYAAYFAFVTDGGNPDNFAGLPVPPDFGAFAAALNAYADFLANGGFPADFSETDLSVLASFIAALGDAGQLDTRLGDNADLLNAYFAFLAGGGAPNTFAGLPIYTQYVSDLNAYFAFLAAGGLPADYDTLDQATLNAFLAALTGTQGGLAGFGDLNAFFTDYAAFVLGGGDPTTFAGLPVFAQYIADLNAYFAFLAAGGLPSEYAVLSQDVLNAYLAALAGAQGGLVGFGGLDQFFIDYFAFIQGGGNVDQFAGLPGNMGGGNMGGGTDGRLAEYLGGFANGAGLAYATFGGNSQDGQGAPSLDDNGALVEAGRISNIDAEVADIAGDALAVIGTYTNGDAMYLGARRSIGVNGGLPYVALAPITGDFPTSGTIDYEVLAATRPVFMDEAFGPGTFEGSLSLRFGATPGYRTTGTITMPEATGNVAYNFASQGADTGEFASISTFDTRFVILRGSVESEGRVCATGNSCQIVFLGNFAGDDPAQRAGFVYDLFASANQARIGGAVIYTPVGTGGGSNGSAGTGTPLILASASDFAATSGVKYNLTAPATALNGFDLPTFTLAANGALTSAEDGVSVRGIGTATATDISGNDRFLIGRWTDGEYETDQNSESTTLTSAQGFHYLLAGPTTGNFTLPTMGSIEYELIAATAPTIADGSLAPGQFQADMIVLLGTAPTVAMEGSITLPSSGSTSGDDYVFSFASTGGIANPDQSDSEFRVRFDRNINFEFRGDQISTSDNSCDENCVIQFGGYFAGDDALEMGLTYTAQTGTIGRQISGAAIFGNGVFDDGSSGGSSGGNGSGFTFAGGFPTTTAGGRVFTTNNSQLLRIPAAASIIINDDGALSFAGSGANSVKIGRGEARDISGDEDIVVGRLVGDDVEFNARSIDVPFNAGVVYLGHSGFTGQLPTSGTISYELYAATSPVFASGSVAPGVFEAALTIGFGSNLQVDMDGSITMPEASGDVVYGFDTNGFASLRNSATQELSFDVDLMGDGAACRSANCTISFIGAFAGNGAGDKVGFAYQTADIVNFGSADVIQGAAAFRAASAGGSGGVASVDAMVPLGVQNSPFAYVGPGSSEGAVSAATMTVTDGVLLAAERGSTRVNYSTTVNSTVEVSGDQGLIGWQRINAVTAVYSGGTGQVFQSNPFVEQYWHTIWGAPLLNMPAMGLINYEFIGGSTAHQTNARPGDGLFSGRFAVDFATLNAGLEATVTLDGPDAGIFDFASAGGVAAPSMRLRDDGFGTMRFFESLATTERGVGNVSRGTQVAGFLAGDGATHAGITYRIRTSSSNSIMGTAAFRATSAGGSGLAPGGSTASIAPSVPPISGVAGVSGSGGLGTDWGRWRGSGSATPQGLASAQTLDLLPPGVEASEGLSYAPAQSREAAIRQAESIMGGAITFARPGSAGASE